MNVSKNSDPDFGSGPSFYEKKIYRAAVSQRLRNTGIDYEV